MSHFDFAKAALSVKSVNPSINLGLVLNAANRVSVAARGIGHVGRVDAEAEVVRIDTTKRIAPIVAVDPDTVERTIADAAEARHG